MRHVLTIMALLTICALPSVELLAFHEAGVANCNGCHTMHNSQDGDVVDPDTPGGSPMLLKNGDVVEVCLTCHANDFGSVLGGMPTSPPPERGGGNFVFLLEDNINDGAGGASNPIPGHEAGHSIVSAGWGMAVDPVNTSAPGGSYPSSRLTCISCHDPHGNQEFRMLRGRGVEEGTGYAFNFDAPQALGIDLTVGSETRTNHTAYQSGWTDWCANCHGMYHKGQSSQGFDHPVDKKLGGSERNSYNDYNGPTDPTGGSFATAYIPETPIEDASITISSTFGATSNSRVSCMTCHRAHATSAPKSTRWDPNVATLGLDGIESGSYPLPNPYTDPSQRPLCVKCHYQESTEHGQNRACMDCHGGDPHSLGLDCAECHDVHGP